MFQVSEKTKQTFNFSFECHQDLIHFIWAGQFSLVFEKVYLLIYEFKLSFHSLWEMKIFSSFIVKYATIFSKGLLFIPNTVWRQ